MAESYSWEQMLDDFRRLGGTAENIVQREGPRGNGLFALHPSQPVRIHAPAHLLLDTEHVVLDGEELVVDPAAPVPAEVRDFFARYQKHFSWGAAGRRDVEAFERSLQRLPPPLLARLKALALLDLEQRHRGEWQEVIKTYFMHARRIAVEGRNRLMPVVELANHSPRSPGFKVTDGVTVEGRFDDEVTVNYSASDALRRFFTYGFVSQEPTAFSLPVRFEMPSGVRLEINTDLDAIDREAKLPVPKVQKTDSCYVLSHLRIGWDGAPRMPRTLVRRVLADVPTEVVDEAFDRIRGANMSALCDLLELSEGNADCASLRRAIVCQLQAIAQCFGVRPSDA